MANKKTNKFYGNKNKRLDQDGYFCNVVVDTIATGERITSLRRKNHLTREEFVARLSEANILGVSVTTMWRWEHGKVKMEVGQIEALCRYFGCSHDKLVVYRYLENNNERDPLFFFCIYFCRCFFFCPQKSIKRMLETVGMTSILYRCLFVS